MSPRPLSSADSPMTPRLTFLFAAAGAAAVANLYWAQPLLDFVARDLHASTAHAGWLVTATQIGYAVGVFLVVPLGDRLDRRRLVPTMLGASALALVACAVAPSLAALLAALAALGLVTVAGQLLTPLAGDLAPEADRGRVVGAVVSGLLTGILVSRTVSGLVAGLAGWRTIYAVAAVLDVVLAVLLARAIPKTPPTSPPRSTARYSSLLASVVVVIAKERSVRWTLVLGATGFAAFTMFWTALTFLLSSPPFSFSVTVIGLFGLAGLAGAVAAGRAGRGHDRGWSLPLTGLAWGGILVAFVIALLGSRSVVVLVAAIVVLDIAIQTNAILAQARLFAVAPQARSRLNTAYVTSNFIGGALGSALASVLWSAGGWAAVTGAGALLAAFGMSVWALGRRGPLTAASGAPATPAS